MATGRVPTTANSPLTAKGDLFTYSTAPARLAVGANDTALVADSTQSTGLAYKTKGVFNGLTTTGDIIYSSSGTTQARLGIGSTGQVLTVASGVPSWATPAAGGGFTLLSTTTLTSTTTTVSSISGSYKHLFFMIRGVGAGSSTFAMRSNGVTTSNYYGFTETIGNGFGHSVSWSNGNTAMEFNGSIAASNNNNSFGWIYDYSNAAVPFKMTTHQLYSDGNDKWMQTNFVNRGISTSAVNSITFLSPGGGTITGTLLIYGVN